MNPETKLALEGLADAVEQLAYALTLKIGLDTTAEVTKATQQLKRALRYEETLAPDPVKCPLCGSSNIIHLSEDLDWHCNKCKSTF